MNRSGDTEQFTERKSSRFYQTEGYWYYRTREGVSIGPFDAISEAEAGVSDFIDFMSHAEPSMSETLAKYSNQAA